MQLNPYHLIDGLIKDMIAEEIIAGHPIHDEGIRILHRAQTRIVMSNYIDDLRGWLNG